jgi:hypothetical protein
MRTNMPISKIRIDLGRDDLSSVFELVKKGCKIIISQLIGLTAGNFVTVASFDWKARQKPKAA